MPVIPIRVPCSTYVIDTVTGSKSFSLPQLMLPTSACRLSASPLLSESVFPSYFFEGSLLSSTIMEHTSHHAFEAASLGCCPTLLTPFPANQPQLLMSRQSVSAMLPDPTSYT